MRALSVSTPPITGHDSGSAPMTRSPTWAVSRLKSTLTTPKTSARRKRGRQRAPAAPVLQAAQTPSTARSVAASGQGLRPTSGGRLAATAQMIQARGSSGRARLGAHATASARRQTARAIAEPAMTTRMAAAAAVVGRIGRRRVHHGRHAIRQDRAE